jgi:hypothetical protein
MTSFINDNNNEEPKESLHMIMLIKTFPIPTKYHPSIYSDNSILQ